MIVIVKGVKTVDKVQLFNLIKFSEERLKIEDKLYIQGKPNRKEYFECILSGLYSVLKFAGFEKEYISFCHSEKNDSN